MRRKKSLKQDLNVLFLMLLLRTAIMSKVMLTPPRKQREKQATAARQVTNSGSHGSPAWQINGGLLMYLFHLAGDPV